MKYASEVFKDCKEWVTKDDDGTTVTWRPVPLSFPKVGDETFATRVSATGIPLFGTAQVDLVFFRRGNVIAFLGYIAIGPSAAAPSPLEAAAKKANEQIGLVP